MAKLNQDFEGDIQESIIRLKNFSKLGNNTDALWKDLDDLLQQNMALSNEANMRLMCGHRKHLVDIKFLTSVYTKLVHLLFTNDVEERASIYYAALTGRTHLVRWYLSLYLCARFASKGAREAVQYEKTKGRTMMSFREWLDVYDFAPGVDFQQGDFDVCILNALNGGVRDVFERDKYSFEDILGFVAPTPARDYGIFRRIVKWLMGWLESEYIEAKRNSAIQQSQQAKTRQLLPKHFVIDDEVDYDDVSASDYFEDIDLVGTVWSDGMEYRYYSNYVDVDDDYHDETISLIEDDVHYEDEMLSWSEVNDNSPLSAFISSWPGDADGSIISGVDGDHASSLPAEVESTSIAADSCTDEWEILSDVASVRSIKSNATACTAAAYEIGVKSYRDAILKCADNIPCGSTPSKQSNDSSLPRGQCSVKKAVRFEEPNICDDAFDYDFAHQCQKGLRGGKASNMFKGEPKTCRRRGRHRR